jgi:hypothetical protein
MLKDLGGLLMQLAVERWYPVIPERHSVRSFREETIDEEVLGSVMQTGSRLTMPGARCVVVNQPAETVLRGVIGSYGKISGAQAYMAFIVDTNHPQGMENIGYLGEAMVLEATVLQLGTCWVAGFFNAEAVRRSVPLNEGEKVVCVSPLGYPAVRLGLKDMLFKGLAHSNQRKELGQITSGLASDCWSQWARVGLEAARLAPSAANRQPWLFEVDERAVTVSAPGAGIGGLKRLDCGIAMLHFEVGARHAGASGSWEYLQEPQVARFTLK